LPSVTTSCRRFSRIGVTRVIGSIPVTSTSFSCSMKPRMPDKLRASLGSAASSTRIRASFATLRGNVVDIQMSMPPWAEDPRGGASKLVSRLEARGLVQRTAAPVDRRGQVLRLTAQGLALSIRMTETADEVEGAFFAPLSPDEATLLRSLLARILRERGHPGSPAG
jgi:hypothetical protein